MSRRTASRFKRFREEQQAEATTTSDEIVDYTTCSAEYWVSVQNKRPPAQPAQPVVQTTAQLMESTRETGLDKPIAASNRGFQLLQKFGFQGGQGLGKHNQGMVEPVRVATTSTSSSHAGVGILAAKARQQHRRDIQKDFLNKKRDELQQRFAAWTSDQFSKRQLLSNISSAIRVLSELDQKRGYFSHELSKKWAIYCDFLESGSLSNVVDTNMENGPRDQSVPPDMPESESDSNDLEDQIRSATCFLDLVPNVSVDLLFDLLDILRSEHYYCLYCGAQFEDDNDLQAHCPGLCEDDH